MNNTTGMLWLSERIAEDVFYHKLVLDQDLEKCKPGQFINVQVPNRPDLILKRPFGIIDYDYESNSVSYAFQVRGQGTQELAKAQMGDRIEVMLPLGNGFSIDDNTKKIALVGGGLGVFPLYSVIREFGVNPDKDIHTFLGYKNINRAYLADKFGKYKDGKQTYVATEDGSMGDNAYITDVVAEKIGRINPDVVLACGPVPMLKSLKQVMSKHPAIATYASLEERMGCGFGVCLACVCKTNKQGEINHERVCKEGPVFKIDEVEL